MSDLYEVTTYDYDLGRYTPQVGLPAGPFRLWELRGVLRELQGMGYSIAPRESANDVLVERVEPSLSDLELSDYVPRLMR